LSFLFFRIRFIHIHLPWIPQRAPNIASSNSLNIHPEAKELLLPSAFDSHQQETIHRGRLSLSLPYSFLFSSHALKILTLHVH
jgi:hypothetical protein